jgi:hypothetical protein
MPSILVVPAGLPLLRVSPHAFSPKPTVRERARDQGESRTRSRFRGPPPQRLTGEWVLTQDEFDIFYAWHEAELLAGTSEFDVQTEAQGGGPVGGITWWTVRFMGSVWEALNAGGVTPGKFWRVSVELLLIDEIGEFRVPPGMMAEGSLLFTGYAASPGPAARAMGSLIFGGFALAPTLPARAMGSLLFTGFAVAPGLETQFRITTTGDFRVTTTGDFRIRGL